MALTRFSSSSSNSEHRTLPAKSGRAVENGTRERFRRFGLAPPTQSCPEADNRTRDSNSSGKPHGSRPTRKISAGRRDARADLHSLLSRLARAFELRQQRDNRRVFFRLRVECSSAKPVRRLIDSTVADFAVRRSLLKSPREITVELLLFAKRARGRDWLGGPFPCRPRAKVSSADGASRHVCLACRASTLKRRGHDPTRLRR